MALDMGERRIGVALSDPGGIIASPSAIIRRESDDSAITEILGLVAQNEVGRIVVGMPYSLGGAVGPAARRVREFVARLAKDPGLKPGVEVVTWDESFSTVAADQSMREAGTKRKRKKELRDAIAAALILRDYLDSQIPRPPPGSPAS